MKPNFSQPAGADVVKIVLRPVGSTDVSRLPKTAVYGVGEDRFRAAISTPGGTVEHMASRWGRKRSRPEPGRHSDDALRLPEGI